MRPPFRITLLLWLVLITTALNAVRLATAIGWRGLLDKYESFPGVLYIAITGAVWTVTGLFILWGWWHGLRWLRLLILGAALAYSAWIWLDILLLRPELHGNWPFRLVLNLVLLSFTASILLHPGNAIYFRKGTYDRESESSSST